MFFVGKSDHFLLQQILDFLFLINELKGHFQQRRLHIVSHVAYLDLMNNENMNVKRELENKTVEYDHLS